MVFEGTGRDEFAQLVTDHIFGDEHRHKSTAIVHIEGTTAIIMGSPSGTATTTTVSPSVSACSKSCAI